MALAASRINYPRASGELLSRALGGQGAARQREVGHWSPKHKAERGTARHVRQRKDCGPIRDSETELRCDAAISLCEDWAAYSCGERRWRKLHHRAWWGTDAALGTTVHAVSLTPS